MKRAHMAGLVAAGVLGAVVASRGKPGVQEPAAYRTLAEVEPRTPLVQGAGPIMITAPGSYYLTGNVLGRPGEHGIEIHAGNVTLDLNGFAMIGVPGCKSAIVMGAVGASTPTRPNVIVRNGTIRDQWRYAIDLSRCKGAVVQDMVVRQTLENVISVKRGVIERCIVEVGRWAYVVGDGSIVRNCISESSEGILGTNGGAAGLDQISVHDCVVAHGGRIQLPRASLVTGCTISFGQQPLLIVGDRSIIRDVVVEEAMEGNPRTAAVIAGAECVISGCTISRVHWDGLRVGAGSRVSGSIAAICGRDGFSAQGEGVTLENCTARDNGQNGIAASTRTVVRGCTLIGNATGVTAWESDISGCTVTDNAVGIACGQGVRCAGNSVGPSPVGILVGAAGCQIDGNSVRVLNGVGISVTVSGNTIVRNIVSPAGVPAGTAYSIVVGNEVAEIGAAAIVTSPLANVGY